MFRLVAWKITISNSFFFFFAFLFGILKYSHSFVTFLVWYLSDVSIIHYISGLAAILSACKHGKYSDVRM